MKKLEDWRCLLARYYPVLFLAFLLPFLFRWPIFAGDTDLWYHLDGGRYILEHASVPKDSYFSFLEPKREFVDYYWLFQVLVYGIFRLFGYSGLLILRIPLFFSLSLLIYACLVRWRGTPLFSAILFCLFVLFFIPRFFLIRPHMFSYLSIALSLYILELRREWLPFLPFISLVWVNVHGIEYPLMVLIVLSYLFDFLLRRGGQGSDLKFLATVFFCLLSVFINPYGLRLMAIPFIPTEFASLYIQEIRKLSLSDLLSFQFSDLSPSPLTLFNLILLFSILALSCSILEKRARLPHILLFLGGFALLFRANRFVYESALLALPLLRSYILRLPPPPKGRLDLTLLSCLLLIVPFLFVRQQFSNLPPPPFSSLSLPEGVCTFLKKEGGGGLLLNHPNPGGYMRFMLYPDYRIFMDMEVPFLFTNEDMYTAINTFMDKRVFKETMEKYDPDFVVCDRRNRLFREIVKEFAELRPVFFDETSVLYANTRKKSELVRRYGLRCVEPYVEDLDLDELKRGGIYECFKEELLAMLRLYPECVLKNSLLAELYLKEGSYERALLHAEALMKIIPHRPYPYLVKARALKALKRYDLSEEAFLEASKRTKAKEGILKELGLLLYEKGDYKRAYELLKAVTDPFDPRTTYVDLYYVTSSALLSDRRRDAEILLNYGLSKLPAEQKDWVEKYNELKLRMR